jgi:hypothetical protein
MSTNELSAASDARQSMPGIEPWLLVCLLALVPGALIVFLPRPVLLPLLVPICGSMLTLLAAGLIMLFRTEWKLRREHAAARGGGSESPDGRERR